MLNQRLIIKRINFINGLKTVWSRVLPVFLAQHNSFHRTYLPISGSVDILPVYRTIFLLYWPTKLHFRGNRGTEWPFNWTTAGLILWNTEKRRVTSKPKKHEEINLRHFKSVFDVKLYYKGLNWAYWHFQTYFSILFLVSKTINFNRTLNSNSEWIVNVYDSPRTNSSVDSWRSDIMAFIEKSQVEKSG